MFIETLPSGRVRAGFRLPNGRKVTKTWDYQYEAEAWAIAAEAAALNAGSAPELDAKMPPRSASPTLSEYGQIWAAARAGHLVASTLNGYLRHVETFAITRTGTTKGARYLGEIRLDELKRSDVDGWVTRQIADGVGRPTINARLKTLRQITRYAVADRLLDRDPTHAVKFLTTEIRADRTLDGTEETRLLAHASPELRAAIYLATDAGLRWEEVYGLPLDAVLDGYVVIRQVLERDTRTIRKFPKSHKPRTIPLTPRTVDALKVVTRAAARRRGTLVFASITEDGERPVDYWNWRRDVWRKATAKAGLVRGGKRLRFHDLRHTYGTRLSAAGVPRREIAELMGHADEKTTARYIHAGTDGRRRALVLAALVGEVEETA